LALKFSDSWSAKPQHGWECKAGVHGGLHGTAAVVVVATPFHFVHLAMKKRDRCIVPALLPTIKRRRGHAAGVPLQPWTIPPIAIATAGRPRIANCHAKAWCKKPKSDAELATIDCLTCLFTPLITHRRILISRRCGSVSGGRTGGLCPFAPSLSRFELRAWNRSAGLREHTARNCLKKLDTTCS